jgi:hypothetical protein
LPSNEREASLQGKDAHVEEDFYSVDEAARIMKLTPGRIRQMLRASEVDRGVAVVRTEVKVKGVPEAHIFIAPRLQAFALPIIQGIRFFSLLS